MRVDRHNPDRVYSLQTIYGPLYFRDNFGDITNLVSLFYHRVYRITKIFSQGVILDVGANIGLAAAWFARHNPRRRIYCFEPLAGNAALIAMNCPDATVVRSALGLGRGRIKLGVDVDGVMASRIPCQWKTNETEFDMISLDEFGGTARVEQVALMKIDAEGMEVDILRGGREILKKTWQVVAETHGPDLHRETIRHLSLVGFSVYEEHYKTKTGLVFASRR